MKNLNEESNIKYLFSKENFVPQEIYKAKNRFIPIYINPTLFEEIFGIEYDEEKASTLIANLFSITLNKNNSNGELIGTGYADRQSDPMGISLSGNEGSGRAFFYGDCFNIKGDKTSLATSKNEKYNNGKLPLQAGIKETIISNILARELSVPTFETLALLDTTNTFEFISESLSIDDKIEQEKYILPTVIEIRVNKEKELYRVSNAFINQDTFSFEQLQEMADKLAQIEAEKFMNRFLHGSWSVGNISTNMNLIDFDTASFTKGRCPTYSNTNKYKANYFGFELEGCKRIIELLFHNSLKDNKELNDLLTYMDDKYTEYLKKEFCRLIGLDYSTYYIKYHDLIDELFNKFNYLSRQFLPNYYELHVLESNSFKTFIYDFSRFFRLYLIVKNNDPTDLLYGINLLLNETKKISYKKTGFIKDKVEEFFGEYIIRDINENQIFNEAVSFIRLYDELFNEIQKETTLREIEFNQYIINMDRHYLYERGGIYQDLAQLYYEGVLNPLTLNRIINSLIKTNIRNIPNNKEEILCNLVLNEKYLTYMVLAKDYYYFVLVPYQNYKIRFAKLCIGNEDYMFQHNDDRTSSLTSEKIAYTNLKEIIELNPLFLVNGKNDHKEITQKILRLRKK